MGTGWSQDEASQSQQTREEPSYTQPQYNENISTEAKPSETKLKTVGTAADVKPQRRAEEKAADVKPQRRAEEKAAGVKLQGKGEEKAVDYKRGYGKVKITEEVKLPYNCEAILRDADPSIDRSSVGKLNDQLRDGVFLNQKRKKYWVENKNNGNCFMLFAKSLSITWAEDARFWYWPSVHETSDVLLEVAELLNVCWLEIYGKFNTKLLSPGILYEVVFVIKLKDPAYGWEVPVNVSLVLPNGHKQEHKENLQTKLREQWIEVPVGEFINSPENAGEIEIGMYEYEGGEWKRGLVIKGITIRPKT